MKKLLVILVLSIASNSYVLAKNYGAPASSQPGWGSDCFGIIGVIVFIAMIWLFWSSRDK